MSATATQPPLTLGTAGHIDHGKTALVAALTGHDTDRLPEERARGISIALGYAPLQLPSGRRLSLVDVPGHERFVRTMVAGATGVDCFLMVVAADDGVMPQTLEHAEVLAALGVDRGVVAITKADLADPARAAGEAAELLPGAEVVACSARTGDGVADVAAALDRLVAGLPGRTDAAGDDPVAPVLHVDRAFTVEGRGTVVTGTLWSGELRPGDAVTLLPEARAGRIRGLQVHDADVPVAGAGQRVAVNLGGIRLRDAHRGDVLTAAGADPVGETRVLDCALELRDAHHGERVQVHHGTRDVAGRIALLEEDLWQVRLEAPVVARDGDRLVVRRQSPPDTLGGGRVLVALARRHGRREDQLAPLRRRRDGVAEPVPEAVVAAPEPAHGPVEPAPLSPAALALAEELRSAGRALLSEPQLAELGPADAVRELRDAGVALRVTGRLYADAEVLAGVRADVQALIARAGPATLADVRDALGLSRKTAQAFLEHLDAERVTRRLPDDTRVLRRPAAERAA